MTLTCRLIVLLIVVTITEGWDVLIERETRFCFVLH